MRNLHNSSFDPPTLVVLEAAFDEAWLTLKSIGNTTVKPDELARSVLRLATEGERETSGMMTLGGGVVFAITGPRLSGKSGHPRSAPGSSRQRRNKGGGGSFTSRMEDRFRRRFDE